MGTIDQSSRALLSSVRVGNFRHKNNSADDGIDGTNGYFRRISGCSAEQKISEFSSEPFRGREINSEFRSVKQKRSKVPIFSSEPFWGWEHNSEFRSVQQRIETNSWNAVPNHFMEEKPTQNKTRQPNISKIVSEKTTFYVQTNQLFCCCFVKLIFSAELHSIPSFGIGSSAELGMPRNEFFLPWNNRNRSVEFFRNEIPFLILSSVQEGWKRGTSELHLTPLRKLFLPNHRQIVAGLSVLVLGSANEAEG